MKTRNLTIISLLTSIYVVLAVLTPVKILNFKFTFEAFPILVAAYSFGPLAGFLVGGLGSLIYQFLFSGYGLTVTTIFWILPHALQGLFVGYVSKTLKFNLKNKLIIVITIISNILVTLLNSLALYIDSKIFGYYSFNLVFGSIIIKLIIGIVLAIIYGLIINKLLNSISILRKDYQHEN